MRIGLDTSTVVGTKLGGLGYYLQQILEALQKMDHKNEYVVFMPSYHRPFFPVSAANFKVVEIPNWMNHPVGNVFWHAFALPLALKKNQIDVYHVPDFRRALLWSPCRVIRSVHDLVNHKRQRSLSFLRRIYYGVVFRKMMAQAAGFITVSHNSLKDMVEAGFPKEKIQVIHNGVSGQFKPRPMEEVRTALEAYHLPERYVLCVARLEHPQKNHITLLRAWSRLVKEEGFDYQLVLVGERWWNADQIFIEIDRLGLRDRVRYCDYVPSEALPYFYNGAAAFVFPSLYEGFGLPVIEAMASGTPVVASDASSLTEVASGAALMFSPLNDEVLANHLKSVLSDSATREDLIKKGLARAREFTWEKSAAMHLEVFLGQN